MRDRSVEFKDRYRLVKVAGTADIYTVTPAPGDVVNEGTPISKDTLLSDQAEIAVWGSAGDRTPSQAFIQIANKHKSDVSALSSAKADKTQVTALVPRGIIANWYGSLNSIPEGWRLCDGTGGTPDLRDRFVVGAGNAYAVGARGGEPTHTLTESEMPNHSHGITASGYTHGPVVMTGSRTGGAEISTVYTNAAGGSQPHNNMPPYYALCYIMKL